MTANSGRLNRIIVAAMTADRVIGKGGKMPWYIPSDLKRFKELTTGHGVVMGYTTFAQDLGGKPLPNRTNYVVTRRHEKEVRAVGAIPLDNVVGDLTDKWVSGKECFVIGGTQIYEAALPLADRMCITMVEAHIDGDAHFPDINWGQWRPTVDPEASRKPNPKDEYPTRYVEYERIRN